MGINCEKSQLHIENRGYADPTPESLAWAQEEEMRDGTVASEVQTPVELR